MAPRVKWQTSHDNYIIQNYHAMPASQLAEHLGVTKSALLRRARTLAIPKKSEDTYQRQRYTHAEKAFIIDNVNTMGPCEVGRALKRSEESIRIFCKRRKITIRFNPTWSISQIRFLKKHGMTMDLEQLAEHLQKNPQAIRKYANEHGIPIKAKVLSPTRNLWSKTEKDYLETNRHLPHNEIAKQINRTTEAVAKFASQNHLLKT